MNKCTLSPFRRSARRANLPKINYNYLDNINEEQESEESAEVFQNTSKTNRIMNPVIPKTAENNSAASTSKSLNESADDGFKIITGNKRKAPVKTKKPAITTRAAKKQRTNPPPAPFNANNSTASGPTHDDNNNGEEEEESGVGGIKITSHHLNGQSVSISLAPPEKSRRAFFDVTIDLKTDLVRVKSWGPEAGRHENHNEIATPSSSPTILVPISTNSQAGTSGSNPISVTPMSMSSVQKPQLIGRPDVAAVHHQQQSAPANVSANHSNTSGSGRGANVENGNVDNNDNKNVPAGNTTETIYQFERCIIQ